MVYKIWPLNLLKIYCKNQVDFEISYGRIINLYTIYIYLAFESLDRIWKDGSFQIVLSQ